MLKKCLKPKFLWALLLLSLPLAMFGQAITVKGIVTDAESGTPLPGVNIIVKGTANGVTSDFDGNYQIETNQGKVLAFSYVGFATQEIVVSGGTLNVPLKTDASTLDQVVVIGYGTTTIKDATGSLTSVTSEDFNKGNIVTPENLLSGRVAGLTINTGGEPGSGSTIRIRGGASLGASNDPLIVINGLPVDDNSIGGSRSVLSTINPNDIESF
ncbi:MAG: carboxypeptidase-like regulatory domain-containing protein, partial [Flavobacteriales bacterium]